MRVAVFIHAAVATGLLAALTDGKLHLREERLALLAARESAAPSSEKAAASMDKTSDAESKKSSVPAPSKVSADAEKTSSAKSQESKIPVPAPAPSDSPAPAPSPSNVTEKTSARVPAGMEPGEKSSNDKITYHKKAYTEEWGEEWRQGNYPSWRDTHTHAKDILKYEDRQSDGKPSPAR